MTSQSFFNYRHLWLGGIFLTTLATGISIYSVISSSKPNIPNNTLAIASAPLPVTALGRLEPEGEVMRLAAPVVLDGDRLKELRVQVGDRVKAGQIIAVLDASDRFADEVAQAKAQVEIAQAELARVRAGAKQSEIQAQEATIVRLQADLRGSDAAQSATIARWQSEVRTAEAELARFQQLYAQGAVSSSVLDTKRLTAETARAQLQEALSNRDRLANTLQAQVLEATSTRDRIAEVRPVDIATKAREVDSAIAALKRAETNLAQAYIRAPMDGQVLKIRTRLGEKVGNDGIVELGATDRMVAVLEVYQTEIDRVKVGQSATISGQAFQGEVKGLVSQVGLQVERQRQATNQAGENLDRRVIEVKVRLSPEDSRRVAAFTNLQVQGKIQLSSTN
ncbi:MULTISPECIES: HlyD family efflux transporter periplasmic adaptor subunit [Pseudanabaena]|uniref:ABC exporter membrane fusion protein, DevB family n=2 Tax=Pseudanabaena TaxID=1152 RepID=L8N1Y5_9CYAN|nr:MULTISPECIES: HlyD family efflux transporter periplasmic adaptor subunit [Pseudanabaena]ELS32253.1 ABC exporter membrane fusion protein, DevB family [Pseudanabaena biceps PCC 7429]MDG3495502.1 biotin/lipoyl-binding protein [Pseudanabaena catenata USMAC16]